MDSRHYLLALVDTLHEKYSFQDAEYKELVDALAVNKKPLDIENAKYVLIKYDRVEASWDYNVDEPKLVKQEDEHKLNGSICRGSNKPRLPRWYALARPEATSNYTTRVDDSQLCHLLQSVRLVSNRAQIEDLVSHQRYRSFSARITGACFRGRCIFSGE